MLRRLIKVTNHIRRFKQRVYNALDKYLKKQSKWYRESYHQWFKYKATSLKYSIRISENRLRGAFHFLRYRKLWIAPYVSTTFAREPVKDENGTITHYNVNMDKEVPFKFTIIDSLLTIPHAIIDNIKTFYRNTKMFFQRGWYGFSDYDVWDFNGHLPGLIHRVLHQFNITRHTVQEGFTDEEYEEMIEDIREGFQYLEKVAKQEATLAPEEWTEEEIQEFKRINEKHGVEEELYLHDSLEAEKIKKGWKLLEKHILGMWD